MSETYEITYDTAPVGTVRVEKQGLYFLFSCRCRLPDESLYRIHGCYGDDRVDLGICVPMGQLFGMDKKIPTRQIPEGIPSFQLLPKDWKPEIPEAVEPQEPVAVETEVSALTEEEETAMAETEEDVWMETAGTFIPVTEEEPFEYLDELEGAHMEVHDGVSGIVIAE